MRNPPHPDSPIALTWRLMKAAQDACARASSHEQRVIKDAIRSARFFLDEAERELEAPAHAARVEAIKKMYGVD